MACKKRVECREMPRFLVVHVFHEGSEMRVGFHEGRCLRSIDKGSSKFAGLVYTELVVTTWLVTV